MMLNRNLLMLECEINGVCTGTIELGFEETGTIELGFEENVQSGAAVLVATAILVVLINLF